MAITWVWTILISFSASLSYVATNEVEVDTSIFRQLNLGVINNCQMMHHIDLRDATDDYWFHCIKMQYNAIDLMMIRPTLNEEICMENKFVNCIKQNKKKIEVCLDKDQLDEVIEDVLNSVKAGFDYLCSNNSRVLNEFNNQRSRSCFAEIRDDIKLCGENMPKDWMRIIMPDDFTSVTFRYDGTCKKRGQWATCVVKTLDKCEDKLAKNVVQGVFAAMLLDTPCKDVIYQSFPVLMRPETLVETTKPTKITSPSTTSMPSTTSTTTTTTKTESTTMGKTQPVTDEKTNTNKPSTPVKQTSHDDANVRVPAVSFNIMIVCVYMITHIWQVCFAGC